MNYEKGFSLNFGGKAFSHEPAIGYNFYLSGNRINQHHRQYLIKYFVDRLENGVFGDVYNEVPCIGMWIFLVSCMQGGVVNKITLSLKCQTYHVRIAAGKVRFHFVELFFGSGGT